MPAFFLADAGETVCRRLVRNMQIFAQFVLKTRGRNEGRIKPEESRENLQINCRELHSNLAHYRRFGPHLATD
jgi:hypothetical protein